MFLRLRMRGSCQSYILLSALMLSIACGRVGYDPDFSADPGIDAAPGSAFDAASGSSVALVVGSQTCQGTTSVITIGADGIAAGAVLVVQVLVREGAGESFAVVDSKTNNYSLVATVGDAALRIRIFATSLTQELSSGDTIEINHPQGRSNSVMAIELIGVRAPPLGVFEGGAQDRDILLPFTAASSGFSYCAIGIRNASPLVLNEPWNSAGIVSADCGGNKGQTNNIGYSLPSSAAGVTTCSGTINGATQWRAMVATFEE